LRKAGLPSNVRYKSIIDYLITNIKASKTIPDITVYRSIDLYTDHYLLCAKVDFPPQSLNKNKRKSSIKTRRIF
jgi:hypothetical protein